jgi:N-terminal domain of reverse transcriptase
MTSSQDVGAPSHEEVQWHSIDWASCHRHVRRLQTRIVKATQEGRWNKVKALQHLLTHSFAAKALAVKRVTENQGKRTPGVDRETWSTPQAKSQAVLSLKRHSYKPLPLKRVYIPKSNGKMRPPGHTDMCCTLPLFPGNVRDSMGSPPGGSGAPIHRHDITLAYIQQYFEDDVVSMSV